MAIRWPPRTIYHLEHGLMVRMLCVTKKAVERERETGRPTGEWAIQRSDPQEREGKKECEMVYDEAWRTFLVF